MKDLTHVKNIRELIHTIRDKQVIIDSDLADLYEVETKALNQAVRRNKERFPEDFMFQLTEEERENLRFQNGTPRGNGLRSQTVTLEKGRGKHRKYLPYVFTEQGVAMLSGVLRSRKAIEVNIQIMRAFVAMRRFISKNAEIFLRLNNLEKKQIEYDENFKKIFDAIENSEIKQGIFFNGQVFDAHNFISELIRKADKSIILIDNYIDNTVLTLFRKRKKDVSVTIYTKNITKQLRLDINKFNSQYEDIEVKEFKDSHDRFMIIDDKDIYHIGASLKDLGKKWFAFSKFDKDVLKIVEKLG